MAPTFKLAAPISYDSPVIAEVPASQKALLLYMALRERGNHPPATREHLLADTRLSERTLDTALAQLKRSGYVLRFA